MEVSCRRARRLYMEKKELSKELGGMSVKEISETQAAEPDGIRFTVNSSLYCRKGPTPENSI